MEVVILDLLKRLSGRLPWEQPTIPGETPIVVVLLYHDLCQDEDFANWLRVPVSVFESQLDALAEVGHFVGLSALDDVGCLPVDRITFLVTFDDGYHNNAALAAPILERRRIPAIYFVSTGPVASRRPHWTDVVITPIQVLGLRDLNLERHGFGAFRFRDGAPSKRWDDVQRLLEAIKAMGNEEDSGVAGLLAWFRRKYDHVLTEHLPRFAPLSPDEIALMARSDFCTIGSHGHEHQILTRLADDELVHSLSHSRSLLREIIGESVVEFAYPNGDHDERVRAAAAATGYERGYVIHPALVAGSQSAFTIPRMAIGAFDSPALLRFKLTKLLLTSRCLGRTAELEQISRWT